MRGRGQIVVVGALAIFFASACGLEQITQGGRSDETGAQSSSGASSGDDADAGLVGAACGVEGESGTTLCRATSLCPNVVVDGTAHPRCGFRIRGSSAELVCGCGQSICPMGTFSTCAEAASLLANQTELGVCVQVAEGRCSAGTGDPNAGSSGSSGASTCDRQCLAECGGGGGCASVCGC